MTPLGRTTLGLLIVMADLRLQGVDALPDVLGWLLVVVGLGELALRCPALLRARTAAVLAGVLSLADLVHPNRTATTGGPHTNTTTAVVPPEGLQGLLSLGSMLAGLVVVVLLSLRLREMASAAGDDGRARTFGRFAVWHSVVGGLAALVAVASLVAAASGVSDEQGSLDVQGPAALVLVLVVVAVIVVEVAFLVALHRTRYEPWVLPAWAAGPPTPGADQPASGAGEPTR